MMYRLNESMTDRGNFDSMCSQCGWDTASTPDREDLEQLTKEEIDDLAIVTWEAAVSADQIGVSEDDDYPMTVDNLEEAKARWLSAWAEGFEAKRTEKLGTYRLNQDWGRFEPALRAELAKLGATSDETEAILQGAWDAATDVDDVARYTQDELDLLRNN